ncbi:hypothetical protein EUTSA_v10005294mg, partial [Eutrema salsugineum]
IIRNRVGSHDLVGDILKQLCSGVNEFDSYYSEIAQQVTNYYRNRETMNRNMDLELGECPGMWLRPRHRDHCCIYRVPDALRRSKPEAYTPQLVIIGPLHHSLKSQAFKARGDITDVKSLGYLNMQVHKRTYQAALMQRVQAVANNNNNIIDDLREMIQGQEIRIRESYSESTAWIKSQDFVEMIMEDSVFILEYVVKIFERTPAQREERTGDPLMDEEHLQGTIRRDLMLLENQLPYFILHRLFLLISPRFRNPIPTNPTFRQLITRYFGVRPIDGEIALLHFTDFLRFVSARTVPPAPPALVMAQPHRQNPPRRRCLGNLFIRPPPVPPPRVGYMYTAEKLASAGVELRAVGAEPSLVVNFTDGRLEIPSFSFQRNTEAKLRNIMALEQCHYPRQAHLCNHMVFLDYLIDTEKDIDLLVEKGIIMGKAGDGRVLADIVNKLCSGVNVSESRYSTIAEDVNRLCDNNNRNTFSWRSLKKLYTN